MRISKRRLIIEKVFYDLVRLILILVGLYLGWILINAFIGIQDLFVMIIYIIFGLLLLMFMVKLIKSLWESLVGYKSLKYLKKGAMVERLTFYK